MNLTKLRDKLALAIIVAMSATTSAFADLSVPLSDTAHSTATIPEIAKRADNFTGFLYTLIRSFAVCLGLIVVISSLMRVKAISNGEKDGSLAGAWAGVFIGGLLAFSTIWMWTFGKTALKAVES